MKRRVKIGNIYIGDGEKIAVQTMSTYRPADTGNAVRAAIELEKKGCDILRYSVLDRADALAIKEVKAHTAMPIVADIHFDYRLALDAIEGGADKIRINPGNIGSEDKVRKVAEAIKGAGVAVRVGSNTGSIEKEFSAKYGRTEAALAESALRRVAMLEKYGVEDIVVSVKASYVPLMVKAYEYIAERTDYPLHLGVTEAGTEYGGVVKNSIGIGSLLLKGIGDTVRVSLSADPERELVAAKAILSAVGMRREGVEIVACPTCGRCRWNCMEFAAKVEKYVENVKKPLKIAVMGCAVNGPGEAMDADLGIAGAKDGCVIFVKGKIVRNIKTEDVEKEFFGEIDKCIL